MQKNIFLFFIAFIFMACGDNAKSNEGILKIPKKQVSCTEILNKKSIQEVLKEAKNIDILSDDSKHHYCMYIFELSNDAYSAYLTIGVFNTATEAMLEQAVSFSSKKTLLKDVGEKAYKTSVGTGQISALANGNLIHVAVGKRSNRGPDKFDEEKSKRLTNHIFEVMK